MGLVDSEFSLSGPLMSTRSSLGVSSGLQAFNSGLTSENADVVGIERASVKSVTNTNNDSDEEHIYEPAPQT